MRILIADDHAIVRRGLKDILRDEFPSAEITEVGDAAALMLKVIKESWDIVISDLSMPGRTALDVLPEIRQQAPNLPVLILSIYPEEQYAIRVLKAGAAGYLNKDLAPDELINAVRRVVSGRKYITPSVAEKLADFSDQQKPLHEQLSDREFEVMKLLAAGKSVSEIGALFPSECNNDQYLPCKNLKEDAHENECGPHSIRYHTPVDLIEAWIVSYCDGVSR